MRIHRQIDPRVPPKPFGEGGSHHPREHQNPRAHDADQMVRAILALMEEHRMSGPAGAGVLTGVLVIALLQAGYDKQKAIATFSGFWDAVESHDQRERHD
jgi:hypothetical protein